MSEKVLLKDLFEEKMQPKNYYKNKRGDWIITRKNKYYLSCKTEEQAKKIVRTLRKVNWDKTYIPMIKKEFGIVKVYSTNKTGFYRVSIKTNNHKNGYMYVYEYLEDNVRTRYTSKTLRKLRKKVLKKGKMWKPLTEDAKIIENILRDDV